MSFNDWFLLATNIVIPLSIFYLNKKIPKRFGGYILPKKGESFADHIAGLDKNGKPKPSRWEVRQRRIWRTIDILVLSIPIISIIRFGMKLIKAYNLF